MKIKVESKMSIRKITNKNIVLVSLSIFCLSSPLLLVSNVRADDVCEAYPDQYQVADCTKTTELKWSYKNSDDEIPPGKSGVVRVSDGQPPYTWTTEDENISFDAKGSVKKIQTGGPSVEVFMSSDACGFMTVRVTDNCSSTSGTVRSAEGTWVPVPKSLWPAPQGFTYYDTAYRTGTKSVAAVVIAGGYKYIQEFYTPWGEGAEGSDGHSYDKAEEDLYEKIDLGIFRSLDESISRAENQISLAPQYISNDIFIQLFEDGIRHPYSGACTFMPELWKKCGNVTGVICLDNCKRFYQRKYHFAIGASALSPSYKISIWKWGCE